MRDLTIGQLKRHKKNPKVERSCRYQVLGIVLLGVAIFCGKGYLADLNEQVDVLREEVTQLEKYKLSTDKVVDFNKEESDLIDSVPQYEHTIQLVKGLIEAIEKEEGQIHALKEGGIETLVEDEYQVLYRMPYQLIYRIEEQQVESYLENLLEVAYIDVERIEKQSDQVEATLTIDLGVYGYVLQ